MGAFLRTGILVETTFFFDRAADCADFAHFARAFLRGAHEPTSRQISAYDADFAHFADFAPSWPAVLPQLPHFPSRNLSNPKRFRCAKVPPPATTSKEQQPRDSKPQSRERFFPEQRS